MKRNRTHLIKAFISIGVIFSLGTLVLYLTKTTRLTKDLPIDTDVFASYGTFVGGILGAVFSLAGVIMLIKTLESQEDSIEKQQRNFDKQLFETKFFNLLNIHRENRLQINIKDRQGGKIFLSMHREFGFCKEAIETVSTVTIGPEFKLSKLDIINISYLCFFYGAVGESSVQILKERLQKHEPYLKTIFDTFKTCQKNIIKENGFDYKPFEGHQSRLSHYFRHLFQTIRFVDSQSENLFTYQEKYDYIKILRAQLSNQEQAFLFYNSLSDLGGPWEKSNTLEAHQGLITKYNLISNIPTGFTYGINVKEFYPNVKYDGDKISEARKQLIELYETHN
ncbi:putative phage abortive infection protein [Albibacterium profundi]|uniref:Phage abortive infection protein n=1 Tax=Albibacterium profundi TaxID=3134906 RepID=A0ABV5CFP6_9SPHI